jgi:septum formation protein
LLLQQSKIPFQILDQHADEAVCKVGLTLVKLVQEIAKQKMSHVVLPHVEQNTVIFVLTADTLCQDQNGNIIGKPESRAHAHEMIRSCRQGFTAITGFCIEKKLWNGQQWQLLGTALQSVSSTFVVDIPDELIDFHIDLMGSMNSAGGATIEDFGMQFVKSIHGSYTNVLGLPLYEVRQELLKLGFIFNYNLL